MAGLHHFNSIISLIRSIYGDGYIPLHRPVFNGEEKLNLVACIDSNFVSSIGEKVCEFESKIAQFVGAKYAVATVNGTSALHLAMLVSGVKPGDEVLTQALSFVATANAIKYANASPIFLDVNPETMGMCPEILHNFLKNKATLQNGVTVNKTTGNVIRACVPMHSFGMVCHIDQIADICRDWGIELVEDAAESLGSYFGDQHTGTFGAVGVFSFNGNKIITTGGGGMLVTDDEKIANHAKHLSTTAKAPHPYEYFHDELGFNYRMPNINAALGCAQIDQLPSFLDKKAEIASLYQKLFSELDIEYLRPIDGTTANNWLNTVIMPNLKIKNQFLEYTNTQGIMTRPIWKTLTDLPMYVNSQKVSLPTTSTFANCAVNLPSSVPDKN